MKKFMGFRSNRFVPAGLVALAAAVLLAPAPASATPFVVKVVQQGSNVVATGSGEFDLTGLTSTGINIAGASQGLIPSLGYIAFTPYVDLDSYTGFSGPANFGSGLLTTFATEGGDTVEINDVDGRVGAETLYVPQGYTSGTALSDSAIWDNASFASLGATPGTYVWSWGSAADQTFTLIIGGGSGGGGGSMAVPEPAALGMFGFGMLLIGGFVGLRRRAA